MCIAFCARAQDAFYIFAKINCLNKIIFCKNSIYFVKKSTNKQADAKMQLRTLKCARAHQRCFNIILKCEVKINR
ncbi:MAG TPA: hypothetical protein DCP97_02930 [Ruminococcaceae bacterium]|nr:hypothetical protein [Oscillospiraceae bacterium]